MSTLNPVHDNRPKWNVHSKIEKYHTPEAYAAGVPDEVVDMASNCLLNKGVNILWGLVAGFWSADQNTTLHNAGNLLEFVSDANPSDGSHPIKHFDNENSFIVVGDNKRSTALGSEQADTTGNREPTVTDQHLWAEKNYLFQFMDTDSDFDKKQNTPTMSDRVYPKYGVNQKIVFRSEFPPGTACFEWREWAIALGNGNNSTNLDEEDVIRTVPKGGEPAPDPIPVEGTSFPARRGSSIPNDVIFLNHKKDNMGVKFSSATWVVSIEISLS